MLNFIKNALQTILDTLNTTLTHVTVQDVNSLEKGVAKKEENILTIVYRANQGEVTTIKAKDRYVSGVLNFFVLESEKATIQALWDEFLETYNKTLQTDRIIFAGQIAAIGPADNVGSKMYQLWQAQFDVQIIDSIGTLKDISITIDTETIDAESGLLSYTNRHEWVLAEAPIGNYITYARRYKINIIEISVLDMNNDFTDLMKTYLYDNIPESSVTITDVDTTITFNAELSITKSAQQKAFNSYQIIIRRG